MKFKIKKSMPKWVKYARFFCAGAIFASIVLQYAGIPSDAANIGLSSVSGFASILGAKKLAILA